MAAFREGFQPVREEADEMGEWVCHLLSHSRQHAADQTRNGE